MKLTDQKKRARVVVSDRLRLFFNQLKEQLAIGGAAELWKRAEIKLNEHKKQL
jgi:hypothetical protein